MKRMYLRIIACLLLTLSLLPACGGDSGKGKKGEKAGSRRNIVETGELAAVNSSAFTMQRYLYFYEMKIIGMLEHGTIVNTGDSIIQLDPTEVQKYIIDRETDLETQLASFEKMLVNQDNRLKDLEAAYKNEQAAFNLKTIELEAARFEPERIQRIKQLEFKQAELTLAKAKRHLDLYELTREKDLRIQEVRVRRTKDEIAAAYAILPKLTIRTAIPGVFQIATNYDTGSLFQVGDNVYQRTNMANVPDLSEMKVNTQINENDFLKLSLGQQVIVRMDAMPHLEFEGKIAYIGKLCHLKKGSSKQKVFDVEVEINKSDERLKPGMTVSCEFIEN